jgi:sorting nexin-13
MADLFEMMQSRTFMQQLGYGLLKIVLVHLFPELKLLFRKIERVALEPTGGSALGGGAKAPPQPPAGADAGGARAGKGAPANPGRVAAPTPLAGTPHKGAAGHHGKMKGAAPK